VAIKPVIPGNESKWPWAHLLLSVFVITKPELINMVANLWDMQCCCTVPSYAQGCTCRCCILIVLIHTANLCLICHPVADRDNLGLDMGFWKACESRTLLKPIYSLGTLSEWLVKSTELWQLVAGFSHWRLGFNHSYCGICGVQSGNGTHFVSKYFCVLCQYRSINSPY